MLILLTYSLDELVLHYNLSILIVSDIATTAGRDDLLTLFSTKRTNAESWVMNCLQFGLNNKYTLQIRPTPDPSDPSPSPSASIQSTTVAVPLVAVDPYPHHVVAAVKLMQHAIYRDLMKGKISVDAYKNLLFTLKETLEQLPYCSKSVQIAKAEFAKAEDPPTPISEH